MRILKPEEYRVLQQLCQMSQKGLKKAMYSVLKKKYGENVWATKDYIIAEGNIPIALVAHMDTVFKHPPQDIYYDREKNVIWSPSGLGADDRAGVFAITQILKTKLRPHIILTTDEELGALGAVALTTATNKPFADMKYIIQLDRRGTDDCVFYNCENKKFQEYVESFGFVTAWGSFSDISEICPMWGVAGVNLSIGYMNEHNTSETLHVAPMLNTINKVINMLEDADSAEYYNYVSTIDYRYYFDGEYSSYYNGCDYGYGSYYDNYYVRCNKCHNKFSEYEAIPVKAKDGATVWYCPDCFSTNNIGFCEVCNEAFELDDGNPALCKDCRKKVLESVKVKVKND